MGSKNKKYNKPLIKPETPPWLKYALFGGIIIITFCCYHYSISNEFTNWDDDRFIVNNVFVKSFSATNLKMILFHDVTGDYFNPLTMLSYAINYHFSGLAPQSYYLTNIILHILNSCLMFFLVFMMLKAMEKNGYGIFKWKEWLAFFCAMAFAIHPMHVESVSWIAERKDVLYALFYFSGMMAYIHYTEVKTKRYHWLILTLVCFILSVLSKPMAIVFPFSLMAIDVLLKRDKATTVKNIILEKLPFILVSLVTAIATYHLQKLAGAVHEQGGYTTFQRFLFACYNFYMYIVKAFIPISLSPFYPYPDLVGDSGNLPLIFYLSPFITLSLVAIPLYFSYRSMENNFRIIFFGLGFYSLNMIMISQIITAGPTIMADRYSYVCYFGIFFTLTCFIYKILEKGALIRAIGMLGTMLYIVFLAILCDRRTFIWHNSETIWTDVIKKYPKSVGEAYTDLGLYYFRQGMLDKAYENLHEAIKLETDHRKAYYNMGLLMYYRKQYDSVIYYYSMVLKMDSNDADTYTNRGNSYFATGKYDLAIKDYIRSFRLNPLSEDLLSNMANTYFKTQQFDSAIIYYTRLIQINPANPSYFHYRGLAKIYINVLQSALDDFKQNLILAPHDSECLYCLSVTYGRINDFSNAYKYAQMAQHGGYPVPDNEMNYLKTKLGTK